MAVPRRPIERILVAGPPAAGLLLGAAAEPGHYFSIVDVDGSVVAERISEAELAASHPEVAIVVDHGLAIQMADVELGGTP